MAILNCLWIGALAGLVAGRLMRGRTAGTPLPSSIAVGVLGALLGGRADAWIGSGSALPHTEMVAAAVGAVIALAAWWIAQRALIANPAGKKPAEGG
jgi:uncharacterized membrane protein YeaQ/YmgE (transglycosylase-associated protein family)